jgi:hypothetical protein
MNCCDYDCDQGRNCPARKTATCPHCYGIGYDASGYACTCQQADVAKVGRKYQDREPLFGISWRRQLRHLALAMLVCLAVMLVSGLVVVTMGP